MNKTLHLILIYVTIFHIVILFTGCSSIEVVPVVVNEEGAVLDAKPGPLSILRKNIFDIADADTSCANRFWKNRGRAKKAYMRGMALMYAKQVCGQGSEFIKSSRIRSEYTLYNGPKKHQDALEYYGLPGSELSTYAFLIGLGMRESSGKYCEGRDKSADWTQAQNAEAGMFQTAYVSRVFNSELKKLFDRYISDRSQCELSVFSEGVSCEPYDAKTYGEGDGAGFQQLAKSCPAFATQWAAILIRSNYRHFGPIIRKEVEYVKSCESMLSAVEATVKNKCDQL